MQQCQGYNETVNETVTFEVGSKPRGYWEGYSSA